VTNPTPAVAPYVPTYATRVPYLTQAEFLAAPTGVDCSQLIPGGDTNANSAALNTLLASASAYADVICRKILAATLDMQVDTYRVYPDGTIRVPLDYTPIVAVTGVSVGVRAGQLTALTDLSGIWFQRKVVWIPIYSMATPLAGLTAPVTVAPSGTVFAQVSYVNGYANTALANSPAQGATSIQVASALGIYAGLPLTLYADAAATTEHVIVDASYVQGSTTVPLTSPLAHPHVAGEAVSALPREIKQATICLATHLVKTRGAESVAIASMSGGPADVQPDEAGYTEEYQQAVDLLAPHRRAR